MSTICEMTSSLLTLGKDGKGAGMRLQIVGMVSCAALASVAASAVRAQVERPRSFEVASGFFRSTNLRDW